MLLKNLISYISKSSFISQMQLIVRISTKMCHIKCPTTTHYTHVDLKTKHIVYISFDYHQKKNIL